MRTQQIHNAVTQRNKRAYRRSLQNILQYQTKNKTIYAKRHAITRKLQSGKGYSRQFGGAWLDKFFENPILDNIISRIVTLQERNGENDEDNSLTDDEYQSIWQGITPIPSKMNLAVKINALYTELEAVKDKVVHKPTMDTLCNLLRDTLVIIFKHYDRITEEDITQFTPVWLYEHAATQYNQHEQNANTTYAEAEYVNQLQNSYNRQLNGENGMNVEEKEAWNTNLDARWNAESIINKEEEDIAAWKTAAARKEKEKKQEARLRYRRTPVQPAEPAKPAEPFIFNQPMHNASHADFLRSIIPPNPLASPYVRRFSSAPALSESSFLKQQGINGIKSRNNRSQKVLHQRTVKRQELKNKHRNTIAARKVHNPLDKRVMRPLQ